MGPAPLLTTLDGQLTPGQYNPLRFTFLIWVMVIVGGSGNNWGAVLRRGFLIWFLWVEAEPVGGWLMNQLTMPLGPGSGLRAHLLDAAPYMRPLLMGIILLVVLRFAPKGLIPERGGQPPTAAAEGSDRDMIQGGLDGPLFSCEASVASQPSACVQPSGGRCAARISALASSLAHSAGPFMWASRQPSSSISSVTGRPTARFAALQLVEEPDRIVAVEGERSRRRSRRERPSA